MNSGNNPVAGGVYGFGAKNFMMFYDNLFNVGIQKTFQISADATM